MRRHAPVLFTLLTAIGAIGLDVAPARAQCGAICLYEVGTLDMGASAAGAGARAQDPGTVVFNPAGMTRLEDTQVHVGMVNAISNGSLQFNVSDKTTPNPPGIPPFAGFSGGGDLGDYLPLAGAYASHELTDRFRIGFAFTGIWGGSADYDNDWAGRSFVTRAELSAFALQPTFAYRVTDWLSVGGAVAASYVKFNLEFRASLDSAAPPIQIRDADDWGVYGSVGLLFEPSEDTRVGVYYRSPVDVTLKGDFVNPTPNKLNFDGEMTFPQGVNLSIYHQLTPKLALLGDGGWSDWSEFGYMPATIGPITIPIDREWMDTWRIGAGVHYRPLEKLLVAGGFSYDSSPVRDSKRLPDIPVDEGYRFSTGAQYQVASNIKLGLTYTFLWLGSMKVSEVVLPPTGTVVLDGDYNPAWIHFVGLHLELRFGGPSATEPSSAPSARPKPLARTAMF